MEKWDVKIEFEPMPDDTIFTYVTEDGQEIRLKWRDVKLQLLEKLRAYAPLLAKEKIRRVEIGSVAYFYNENKRRGRFISLNTMFVARLLKR